MKHTVWILVAATLADRTITLPFYRFESNPLVTALGPSMWLLVTTLALVALVSVWYRWELHRYRICHAWIGLLSLGTVAVVLNNVAVAIA